MSNWRIEFSVCCNLYPIWIEPAPQPFRLIRIDKWKSKPTQGVALPNASFWSSKKYCKKFYFQLFYSRSGDNLIFLYFLLVATKFSVHLLIAQLIFIRIREPSVFSIDETSIFNTLLLRQMTECEFSVIFSFIFSIDKKTNQKNLGKTRPPCVSLRVRGLSTGPPSGL